MLKRSGHLKNIKRFNVESTALDSMMTTYQVGNKQTHIKIYL